MKVLIAVAVFALAVAAAFLLVRRSLKLTKDRWRGFAENHGLEVSGVNRLFDRPAMRGSYDGASVVVDMEGRIPQSVSRSAPCLRICVAMSQPLPDGLQISRESDEETRAAIGDEGTLRAVDAFLESHNGWVTREGVVLVKLGGFGTAEELEGLIEEGIRQARNFDWLSSQHRSRG